MSLKKRYLVGDVGGTKTLLTLLAEDFSVIEEKKYMNSDHNSFMSLISDFLKEKEVSHAIFGVAGPVIDGKCDMTNLSWALHDKEIEKSLPIKKVTIVNDLIIQAKGILHLKEDEKIPVAENFSEKNGRSVLISVGTGLGEAWVYEKNVFATEGGHCDYAPSTDEEIQLLHFFQNKYEHVSFETLLSGKGVSEMYEFYSGTCKKQPADIFLSEDPNCIQTKKMFFATLGKEAAICGLKNLPFNGIYLYGGVICKNIEFFLKDVFLENFYANSKMKEVLQKIPVYMVKEKALSICGAKDFFR